MTAGFIGLLLGWAIGSISVIWLVIHDLLIIIPESVIPSEDVEDHTDREAVDCVVCGRLTRIEDICYGECTECWADSVVSPTKDRWSCN